MRFDRAFDPRYGTAVPLEPGVRRLTAPNPGPYTFHGTNTYLVGEESLAIIDPGPDDDAHLAAVLAAVKGRPVSHIVLTHTHLDHSPLVPRLQQATGAQTVAQGPHRLSRPLRAGEVNPVEESCDFAFRPDRQLRDGELLEGRGWRLRAVLTPGHCANHACFALEGTGILFSGDHVMAWSSSVVAPPDGSMADYMASLDRLEPRHDRLFYPGHGGPVLDPQAFVRELREHRQMREQEILACLGRGERTVPDMVRSIYPDLAPALHGAAASSVLAQLEWLIEKGRVATGQGEPSRGAVYGLA